MADGGENLLKNKQSSVTDDPRIVFWQSEEILLAKPFYLQTRRLCDCAIQRRFSVGTPAFLRIVRHFKSRTRTDTQ